MEAQFTFIKCVPKEEGIYPKTRQTVSIQFWGDYTVFQELVAALEAIDYVPNK